MADEEDEKSGIKGFIESHPKLKWGALIVAIILVFWMVGQGYSSNKKQEETKEQESVEQVREDIAEDENDAPDSINGGTDEMLARLQDDLKTEYGDPPEGFIWDQQGNPVSLGIKSMSSEDVVYSYLRAISTLDLGMAQKLSRGSSVVSRYSDYYSSTSNNNTDYADNQSRGTYRQTMLSLENNGVSDSSVFADNKRVYSVKATVIDLSDKDFWEKDKKNLFKEIYKADQGQSDTTKAELYVNQYVLDHYKSKDAKKSDVSFTVTVEKYPDLNSGWLISIDKELDDILSYSDGTTVTENIMTEYRYYKQDQSSSGD